LECSRTGLRESGCPVNRKRAKTSGEIG